LNATWRAFKLTAHHARAASLRSVVKFTNEALTVALCGQLTDAPVTAGRSLFTEASDAPVSRLIAVSS
jgi:hypothetical protein